MSLLASIPFLSWFRRHSIILPLVALYLYACSSASFLGQWDSYDYLKQIVSHQLSALGVGRPIYLGYNIAIWETARTLFHLGPTDVEIVAMATTVVFGVIGVLLFRRLAREFLSAAAARAATLGLAVAPMYAVYSGFVMTEIPMMAALMAAALTFWKSGDRHPVAGAIAAGVLFGVAAGIREQALTAGAVFLWIAWSRPQPQGSRVRSALWFLAAGGAATIAPVLLIYLLDPPGFAERIRIWLHAIPMGRSQFWNNVDASLLYTLAVCPASWLALAAAGALRFFRRRRSGVSIGARSAIPHPRWGAVCSIVLPIVLLWRDADIQIHPRYAMIALPGALILCAHLYERWVRSRNAASAWAVSHVLAFGLSLVILLPVRQVQSDKMEFARRVKDAVPGEGLFIAGSYSPMFDYYRGIGVRPGWQILWSGWGWTPDGADAQIRRSWDERIPVYLSEDPLGWRFFEPDYLHYHYLLHGCKKERVIPGLVRVSRP